MLLVSEGGRRDHEAELYVKIKCSEFFPIDKSFPATDSRGTMNLKLEKYQTKNYTEAQHSRMA